MDIKELRDTKLIIPIDITAMVGEKQISQQELNLISQKMSELLSLTAEERRDLVNELIKMGPAEKEAYFASFSMREEIVSAPIQSKAGTKVIDNIKSAKKEVKRLSYKVKEYEKLN
ncbi:MAG: hypothetical protein ACFFAN_02485 [Promethearchaeota archaeon]